MPILQFLFCNCIFCSSGSIINLVYYSFLFKKIYCPVESCFIYWLFLLDPGSQSLLQFFQATSSFLINNVFNHLDTRNSRNNRMILKYFFWSPHF